jgi:transcriptional regulator PpsR
LATKKPLFQDFAPGALMEALQSAADVAMTVSGEGQVIDVVGNGPDVPDELVESLRGHRLADTVTDEGRSKVEALLGVAAAASSTDATQDLFHRLDDGSEIPIRYRRVAVHPDGRVALLGRDQRAFAALQQQVLDAQMALEQDYWRLRYVETRYRLLFKMAGEPLLIVDEVTRRVIEANELADALLADEGKSLVGKPFPIGCDNAGIRSLQDMLSEAAAVGRAEVAAVRAADGERVFSASATLLRQGNDASFLVRLHREDLAEGQAVRAGSLGLANVIEYAPDAIVLTDTDGAIKRCNRTFLEMAQLASAEQIVARSIDRWLGRSGVDLSVLLNNLRQHQSVRLFATKLRSEYGDAIDVEISVGSYHDADGEGFAFFIRDVSRRLTADPSVAARLPRSVDQITQQVGRVPLKELVRRSTDLVEKLCIETALELTGDNRASAAELLGVSRQGLYAKLNRYNLAEKVTED